MSFAFKPAPQRSFTRSKPKTPPPPSSNSPAAPGAFFTPPPPRIPATLAASKLPAPKALSSSSTTASSPPISETPQPLPNPPPSTKTKAPLRLPSLIFAAISPSSKIFSRPSSRIAPPLATGSKVAAASPSSKPSTAPQKLPIVSQRCDRQISESFAHVQEIRVKFASSIVVHEVQPWPQLSRLLKKAFCRHPLRLRPSRQRSAIWPSTPFAASSCSPSPRRDLGSPL